MSEELEMNDLPYMATHRGWVFMGFEPMTDADVQKLKDYLATGDIVGEPDIDRFSECGRLNAFWTAKIFIAGESSSEKMGGLGSHTYETQFITDNYGSGDIEFKDADQGEIWHINPEGERVYGLLDYPKTGRGYHVDMYGQSAAGPKPKTSAAEWLGDGVYEWEPKLRVWIINK